VRCRSDPLPRSVPPAVLGDLRPRSLRTRGYCWQTGGLRRGVVSMQRRSRLDLNPGNRMEPDSSRHLLLATPHLDLHRRRAISRSVSCPGWRIFACRVLPPCVTFGRVTISHSLALVGEAIACPQLHRQNGYCPGRCVVRCRSPLAVTPRSFASLDDMIRPQQQPRQDGQAGELESFHRVSSAVDRAPLVTDSDDTFRSPEPGRRLRGSTVASHS
jgi:hypothetical protein